jgi:hypothetical protein
MQAISIRRRLFSSLAVMLQIGHGNELTIVELSAVS